MIKCDARLTFEVMIFKSGQTCHCCFLLKNSCTINADIKKIIMDYDELNKYIANCKRQKSIESIFFSLMHEFYALTGMTRINVYNYVF